MNRTAQIGFVFPGQGSQYVGMGKTLSERYPEARDIFKEADDVLGYKLSDLCFYGPEDSLKLTANTQPAILTVSIAAFTVLKKMAGITAAYMTGHSLGEYSALVAAGGISFRDAVKTVHLRGTFMQEAVPVGEGTMAAILGLEDFEVEEGCREVDSASGHVAPANYNSPGQIVISGNTKAVHSALEVLKAKGCKKAVLLPVSAPFHSALMQPAAEKLKTVLNAVAVTAPVTKVVGNVNGEPYRSAAEIKGLLVDQLVRPVRWVDCVKHMTNNGINEFLEIGPGKVLSGLIKRIDKNVKTVNIDTPDEIELFVKLFGQE